MTHRRAVTLELTAAEVGYLASLLRQARTRMNKKVATLETKFGDDADLTNLEAKIIMNEQLMAMLRGEAPDQALHGDESLGAMPWPAAQEPHP